MNRVKSFGYRLAFYSLYCIISLWNAFEINASQNQALVRSQAMNTIKTNALAVIAGRGDLPKKIIATQKDKRPIVIIAFEGQTPAELTQLLPAEIPVLWVKLGVIEPILDFFKKWHVTEVTMAGGLTRPKLRDLSMDKTGARWLAALGTHALKGDDHLLSGIIKLLEKEGLTIIPPHNLVENLFTSVGTLTVRTPSTDEMNDIKHGIAILKVLSPYDIGQAIAVHDGCVLGIETIEGTAALLNNIKALGRTQGGAFVKMRKVGQNQKVDLPTIGIETINQVRAAGLAGLAIEANGVQVLDLPEVIRLANEAGLFLISISDL